MNIKLKINGVMIPEIKGIIKDQRKGIVNGLFKSLLKSKTKDRSSPFSKWILKFKQTIKIQTIYNA